MSDFDLQRAIKEGVTRADGAIGRIAYSDRKGTDYPVGVFWQDEDREVLVAYTADGTYKGWRVLRNLPRRVECYVDVHNSAPWAISHTTLDDARRYSGGSESLLCIYRITRDEDGRNPTIEVVE